MKCHGIIKYAIFLILTVVSSVFSSTEKYWQASEEALADGLPRTAVENLDKVLQITQKEKRYDEWMRALSEKVVIEATIQGNKPEEKITRLKIEFSNADENTRPLLQAVLAQWYWHYYDRNRWRFMNRTATENMSEDDFTTWDLPKIFRQIDSLYQDILKERSKLSKIQVQWFLGFLEKGTMPEDLRPTLYDFIAQEALNFYASADQAAARPEDAFDVDAKSDAFAASDGFLKYKPVTEDTGAAAFKALTLYQSLMAYHREEGNTEAFLDLDIQRLRYIKNIAFGEDRNSIFIERMTNLVDKNTKYEISSMGAYYLAQAWAEQGDLVKAHGVAKRFYDLHPKAIGGQFCYNYMLTLEAKSLRISGEDCVPTGPSKIQATYKNFTKLYFRVYHDDWDDFMKREYGYPNEIDSARIMKLLSRKPVQEWAVDLKATDDYKEKNVDLDIPKLASGYYRILASWQPDFKSSSMVQHAWLWVSNITLVSRTHNGIIDGLVLDAVSGEPVANATVTQIIQREWRFYKFGTKTVTDSSGFFKFDGPQESQILLYIKKNNDALLKSDGIYAYRDYEEYDQEQVLFFTDRSLYRPGQTIHFKGICVYNDKDGVDYHVIPNHKVTVFFRDANYQEIAKLELMSNDFGSFSGEFIAPADRLTGSMSIQTHDPEGYTSVRVEEYKRPKFTVELETPKEAVKLKQEIEIKGKAIAYTGAPIDNAQVRFSVVRNASYPYWWSWFYRWSSYSSYSNTSQQIAHGRVRTDAEGNFTIKFFAQPDLKMSPDDDPIFNYSIHADVVSTDGETRSADTYVRLGYSALSIMLSSGESLEDNKTFPLIISTQTLDGNKLKAKAALKIFRLKEPTEPVKPKLSYYYYYDYGYEDNETGDEAGKEFGENWMAWPQDKVVYETGLSTEISNPDTLDVRLETGLYKVECTAKDEYGKEVKAFLPLMILPDWNAKQFTIKLPSVSKVRENPVEVGKNAEVIWGSGYDQARCFVEIEHDGTILKRYWTQPGMTLHSLKYPVMENFRGGFTVHLTQVRENRAYINSLPIYVPWDNKELEVSIATLRDKLQPGEKETMTLEIKGKKQEITAAEIVATLYDFSLDQFYPHNYYAFSFFKYDYSRMYASFVNNAQGYETWRWHWNPDIFYPEMTYVHFPSYVIENFFYYQFPSVSKVIYSDETFEGKQGRIKGKVIDVRTTDPLVNAVVRIEDIGRSDSTDEKGTFVFNDVPAGTYNVTAEHPGYEYKSVADVKVMAGKYTIVNFKLRAGGYYEEGVISKMNQAVVSQTATGRAVAADELSVTRAPAKGDGGARAEAPAPVTLAAGEREADIRGRDGGGLGAGGGLSPIDLKNVVIRKNLNETAFFYPHLLMDKNGTVKIEFTMPEALTKWKFLGFAHSKKCESGVVSGFTVTQKELMVQPNAPRFLRESDTIYFTAKVINMSDKTLEGKVQLDLKDFMTDQPANELLKLADHVQSFKLEAKASAAFSWRLCVPKGAGPLTYTVAAKSGKYSDGETGALPVLSTRIFLTESVPLNIRGPAEKIFTFERLKQIGVSKTLEPFKFTLQMASNPIWYAIQALPYLVEFPYECTEQVFNRYYANSLAGHIANSDLRIKEVFDQWRGTDALKSNLEKNEELKSVMLMETPWVIEAQDETQAKRNVGILFEENTLKSNLNSAFNKLKNYQYQDGSWPWFPGGYPDPYITLYITTGFGRLQHLGVKTDVSLAILAVDYLDRWVRDIYDHCIKSANNLTPMIALYLYCRSFYLESKPLSSYYKEAVDYFIGQGEEYWLTLNSRLSQGYLSLALKRFKKLDTPQKILASIKERSVSDEEMGMFWREDELSWWWYRAPIETQALMIEAFSEVTDDTIAMEDCKVWLLKQKQTQNWQTTKATADAVYALILRGTDYLANTKLVGVTLGTELVKPENVEAGTGYYKSAWNKSEIKPEFSKITLNKEDKGIAWCGVHFQFFEEMEAVTTHETNLKLDKKLFVKRETKKGTVIEPLKGPLSVGDIMTVRIALRVDRDMEYVHLKDMRGSGLEPVDVLSYYQYQDGLRYYQSTKDIATHFFIDYLPKGTYVFEYDLRVQLRGRYQNGVAEIQCMYAPEFSSHSASEWLEVR